MGAYSEYLGRYNTSDPILRILRAQGWDCSTENRPELRFGDEFREYLVQISLDYRNESSYKFRVLCDSYPNTPDEKILYDADIEVDKYTLFDDFAGQMDRVIRATDTLNTDVMKDIEEARANNPRVNIITFRAAQNDTTAQKGDEDE